MVKQVDVPTFSGHRGVLHEHVPTIAMLQPGYQQYTVKLDKSILVRSYAYHVFHKLHMPM